MLKFSLAAISSIKPNVSASQSTAVNKTFKTSDWKCRVVITGWRRLVLLSVSISQFAPAPECFLQQYRRHVVSVIACLYPQGKNITDRFGHLLPQRNVHRWRRHVLHDVILSTLTAQRHRLQSVNHSCQLNEQRLGLGDQGTNSYYQTLFHFTR